MSRWRGEHCVSAANVSRTCRSLESMATARSALEAIRARPPHVLFLDIQIDSQNGVELARSLDPDSLPLIVFVTAYHHYALEAFEVSAVDYLLKPFDDDRFRKTLARVRRRREAESGGDRSTMLNTELAQLERRCSRAGGFATPASSPNRAAGCTCSTSRRSSWSRPTATM